MKKLTVSDEAFGEKHTLEFRRANKIAVMSWPGKVADSTYHSSPKTATGRCEEIIADGKLVLGIDPKGELYNWRDGALVQIGVVIPK